MDKYIELFQHYSPVIAPILSLSTFGLGMWMGHKLSLGRDKRKEFNAVADPISLKLALQKKDLNDGFFPAGKISTSDFHALERVMPKRKLAGFETAKVLYKESLSQYASIKDEYGDVVKTYDIPSIIKAIEALLVYVERR